MATNNGFPRDLLNQAFDSKFMIGVPNAEVAAHRIGLCLVLRFFQDRPHPILVQGLLLLPQNRMPPRDEEDFIRQIQPVVSRLVPDEDPADPASDSLYDRVGCERGGKG